MKRLALFLPVLAAAMLLALPAPAADADATGLVPTIRWDFETKPDANGLKNANKGSASISFTSEGSTSYAAGATNGWALDTSRFTPYSGAGTFSTAGEPITVSLAMTLGTNPNGITLNVRSGAGDLIVRRGADAGSLVVGFGPQKLASSRFLTAPLPGGDAAWHLVSVVAGPTGTELYVDGVLADSTADPTLWSASGVVSQIQFGSHLNGAVSGEAKFGGRIDDLRIHAAALSAAQLSAIAADCGLSANGFISVRAAGEPTVGTNSFSTAWTLRLDANAAAGAALVYGTDAALSSPATNALGPALAAGTHTASLAGLSPGTTYWWKIVASNGVNRAETPVASFRTRAILAETDFARRVPITVSGYGGSSALTNFPVLVKLAAGSPTGFDYADCAADGSDLRFAGADGVLLPHEIDTWDADGTSYVWVGLPVVANGTALAMYYGSPNPGFAAPADVWKPYVGVWHMGEASGAVADATGHALDATPAGDTAHSIALSAGVVGNARQTATSDAKGYLSVPDYNRFGPGDSFTMSGWVRLTGCTGYPRLFSRKAAYTDDNGWEIEMSNGSLVNFAARGSGNSPGYSGTFDSALNAAWSHVVLVYDGATLTVYQNGVPVKTGAITAATDNGLALSIGCDSDGSETYAQGAFDECRLLCGAASADWVRAEYDAASDPDWFLAFGAAESTDPELPRLGAIAASDENGTATFSVALAVPGFGGAVPTAVSVFYGTDGENWTELPLGATNEAATLTGAASGLAGNVRVLWYAAATAARDGAEKATTSLPRSFVTRALDPAGHHKSFTATVDWDGAAAEDIPVLIRLSESAILGFSYADVTADGLEILDGSGHLVPFEIDAWNTNGESIVWARLPDYRDGATLTVRYGTAFSNEPPATNIWSDCLGVWHMNEASPADASPAGNDGAAVGAPAVATGEIGPALSLPAAGDYVTCGAALPNSELASGFTVEGWANPAITSGKRALFGKDQFISVRIEDGKIMVTTPGNQNHAPISAPVSAGTWFHWAMTFVPGDRGLKFYANGEPAGTQTATGFTDATSSTEMWLGHNQWEEPYSGLLDEMRLRAGIRSAAWLAAEYHAMADPSALACSAVASSDTTAPVLGVPSVARNADGTFTVSVEVSGNAPDTIFCTIAGTDRAMATASASLPATYSAATPADLPAGTHTASIRASSANGTTVSATCPTAFHAGALAVEVLANADEGTLTPGTFRISRADADPTDLPAIPFDVAFSGDGLAAIAAPGAASLAIPAAEASVDIEITPVLAPEVTTDTTVALAVSGAFVGTSSSGAMTIVDAPYDPAVRYVSTTGSDENHGGAPELPKKTIGAAVSSLANIARSRTCTVHVAPGLYPISAAIDVAEPIRVLGDDPDPSRTVVSNTVGAGDKHGIQRVFTIDHADALVANLAMQNGSVWGNWSGGGNFLVGTAGGTVSNCLVEAGRIEYGGHNGGGGGRMEAGLVTHTAFRGNHTASGSSPYGDGPYRAGVLMLGGSARAENCLIADNPQSAADTLVKVAGSATMVNCTIADSSLSRTNENCRTFAAMHVEGSATVRNVVIAGVTNTIDGAPCPPAGSVSNFLDGAFDGDATGLPEGTATGTIDDFFPRHAEGAVPDVRYRPEPGSPLLDAGAEYAPMAALDLSGRQPRLVGAAVDIGCYEDAHLSIEAKGEPTVGLDSFATDLVLGSYLPADVSIVWSADAAFASAWTNRVETGATNGAYEASIGGLEPDATYRWKLVADNGRITVETAPASFRTPGAPTFGDLAETVSGASALFSVELASPARDALGNGLRTYVSVFCTTNGIDYDEKPLGYATRARTLGGAATLPNGVWSWFARAYAELDGRTLETRSATRTFRVFHNETPPAGFHRFDATIAYEGEAAEDVPVLLRLSESIENFRYADVANDGRDLLFSDEDGNRLPYEIESWNPAGESLVWVRLPVFTNGAAIHVDYGASEADGTANAADVWRRYVGVWHLDGLDERASAHGSYPNSTATAGIDGEKAKASLAGEEGRFARSVRICNADKAGAGCQFGGVFVPDAGANSPLDLGSTFAISGWFRHKDQEFYWDKLFGKRKRSNNADAPNGSFAVEFGSNTPTHRLAIFGSSDGAGAADLPSSLKDAWRHLTFVYDETACHVYEDGASVGSATIAAATDNDAPLCFGNLSGGYGDGEGDCAWCGWIDEVRLADGVPTAAWLAAEYAAMADTNAVRFSAARRVEMPVLEGPPVLSWSENGWLYAATVDYGLGDVLLATVDLLDGSVATNAADAIESTVSLPQSLSEAVGLEENRMYRAVAILRASDGSEESLVAAREAVYSGEIFVDSRQDADIREMMPAVVRLSRADTEAAVSAPLTVSFALSGEAVSEGLLEPVSSATIPAGASYVDVEIRPIARSVAPRNYAAKLTVGGANVARPGASDFFQVRNAGVDPYVRFVAPDGDDEQDGLLDTTPKLTIAAALASFSDNARSSLCTVHVAPGLYPISSPIVVTNAVRILGDDPDPSRVVVSNTFDVNWDNQNKRVFRIDHPDALVANLTMQKGQFYYGGHGGNVYIGPAGGTVSNCVVEAGRTTNNSQAAGAFLEGGLVTHSIFRRNRSDSGTAHWDGKWKGVLYLKGKSRAENCLFVDNPHAAPVVLIGLAGSSSMRNCTIADTGLASTNQFCDVFAAINVESQGALLQNVAVAGVTNAIDGAPCGIIGYTARFRTGAFDGDASSLPAETAVGSRASFFMHPERGDYRPRSGGPLVNAGADYEPMADVDLTGVRPRRIGNRVDIGCYEAFSETTILILR